MVGQPLMCRVANLLGHSGPVFGLRVLLGVYKVVAVPFFSLVV
jgi:hypothetical protein